MNDYLLKNFDIELIPVSDKVTLFFHASTLQLYPLQDRELINFLWKYRQSENTEPFMNNDIYRFIVQKIENAPKSSVYDKFNTSLNNFTSIVLPISGKCNLSCPYCFAQTNKGFGFEDFTEKDIEKVIDFVMQINKDISKQVNFIFFGGEPLLNLKAITNAVSYIKENYKDRTVGYSITTNGTIINDEIVRILKENNFAILLSLDGPDNEFNLRKFKNGKTSISRVERTINVLLKNKISLELRSTFVSNNPYLVQTYNFFEQIGIPFNIVFAYDSDNKTNQHLSSYDNVILKNLECQFDRLLDFYIQKVKKNEPIYNVSFSHIANKIQHRIIEGIACGGGINYYTILSNGDIFSCPHLMNDKKYKIGTITKEEIVKDNVIPKQIEELTDCQTCWAKYLCLGGCPAQKLSTGKSNTTSLDFQSCELEKMKWKFYLKLFYHISQINPNYINPKK